MAVDSGYAFEDANGFVRDFGTNAIAEENREFNEHARLL
jgi:hypothetical protein